MTKGFCSRRSFLLGSGSLAGTAFTAGLPAALLAACDARDRQAPFEVLAAGEAHELEAIAARIIPTTDTPGAREAGVVWFFDRSFASIMADSLAFARAGLRDFQAGIPARWPGHRRFSDLPWENQDAHLAAREDTDFFGLLHFMTVAGFLGMSSYGGNRGNIGWTLLGIEERHAWQPPFGHYDAAYLGSDGHVDGHERE